MILQLPGVGLLKTSSFFPHTTRPTTGIPILWTPNLSAQIQERQENKNLRSTYKQKTAICNSF